MGIFSWLKSAGLMKSQGSSSMTRVSSSPRLDNYNQQIISQDLSYMRQDYGYSDEFDGNVPSSWYELFVQWFAQAQAYDESAGENNEPNAMVIASVGKEGVPRTRTVLAKNITPQGIVFYTNYNSIKAQHFAQNPHISATFLWLGIHKQIHVSGVVNKISALDSDAYWAQRPRESQIGAWASQQSKTIEKIGDLEHSYDKYVQKFKGIDSIPRPPHWGGYLIEPSRVEFWSGQTGRMHKRIEFVHDQDNSAWNACRLQP